MLKNFILVCWMKGVSFFVMCVFIVVVNVG